MNNKQSHGINIMKNFFLLALIFFMAWSTTISQESPISREKNLSIYVRLTNVIPMIDPQPCSSFLLPFGVNESDVRKAAKKERLKFHKRDTIGNGAYLLYYVDPDTEWITYAFSFSSEKIYTGIVMQSLYRDEETAKIELDRLLSNMISRWDINFEENAASSTCTNDGLGRFMLIDMNGELLTIAITYTN